MKKKRILFYFLTIEFSSDWIDAEKKDADGNKRKRKKKKRKTKFQSDCQPFTVYDHSFSFDNV